MSIDGEFVPRKDATSHQLRELGSAIRKWAQLAWKTDDLHCVDSIAVEDLMAGELPQPMLLRLATGTEFKSRLDVHPLSKELGDEVYSRTVPFALTGGKHYNRRRIIEGLRQTIPESLVDDIDVDGRTWRDVD